MRYLMAGCGLAGLCSSVYSRGVGVLKQCLDGLNDFMDRKGYQTINDFQGCVTDEFKYLRKWKREDPMADLTPIIPQFNEDKCNQCGVCEKICPYGALRFDKNKDRVPVLNRQHCNGCGWCVGHCKPNAIKCIHAETGAVVWDGFGTISDWVTD